MNPFDDVLRQWRPLQRCPSDVFQDARLQAHWASQVIDAVGRNLVPEQQRFAHLSMTWLAPLEMLAGGFTRRGLRVALSPGDLSLNVLDADDRVEWSLPLDGKTLAEASSWVQQVLSEEGETAVDLEPERDDVPEHPVGDGQLFRRDEEEPFHQLSLWFGNLAPILGVIAQNTLGALPVRAWPHHFDMATLVRFDPDEPDEQKARSINVGLSPGDASYDEPYVYVTPWPAPDRVEDKPLEGGGRWHTEGFTAAVLPAHRLVDSDEGSPDNRAQRQAEQTYAFLESAMASCRSLLGTL